MLFFDKPQAVLPAPLCVSEAMDTDPSLPGCALEGRANADDPVSPDASSLPAAVKQTSANQGVLNDNVGKDADAKSNPEVPQATALEVKAAYPPSPERVQDSRGVASDRPQDVLAPPCQGSDKDTSLPRCAQEGRANADDPVLLDSSSIPSAVKKIAVDLGVNIVQVLCMCQPVYMPLRERFQKKSSRSLKTFSMLARNMVYRGNI